ncbi:MULTISPECIES: ComF family protein [Pontibacillus]|uniref:ComF family protein n=1 Tax=Pontibacillus chungwhensis TaxID=265426 RepID=A0ABY8UVC7_9BACI|nr:MULTISPECIES: ComF family protein [Pontibacillus]MCD5325916.1 ComF family protein [Pontibacillus sp. HN14]WIF97626.1 ComF family protein [Pontibacillus chungwhensis]
MHCLWCDAEIIKEVNWNNLFKLPEDEVICQGCKEQMVLIQGPTCPQCSREMDSEDICEDCVRWGGAGLDWNVSLYKYNDFLKEVVAKWKYRGDYVLVDLFMEDFKKRFETLRVSEETILVPVPLSDERMVERGFNQSEALANALPLQRGNLLSRIHSEKQSKKSRRDRMTTENPFSLNASISKPVLLIDDIYTTGRTLQHAAHLLKEAGASTVFSYTLIRG